jgi:hypothetical protein
MLSNPMGLEPMWYDARVLMRGKQGVSKKQHISPFIIVTPTFCKNKTFVQIGAHIKL